MKPRFWMGTATWLLLSFCVGGPLIVGAADCPTCAHQHGATHCATCQPACSTCAQHHCELKTERTPIKKVVYSVKCVPVCEHKPGKLFHGDCCPVCKLYYKKVLVKREVEVGEKCTQVCEPVENCQ